MIATPRDSLLLVPVETAPKLGGTIMPAFGCGASIGRLYIEQKQEHEVAGPGAPHFGRKKEREEVQVRFLQRRH